MAKLPPDTRAQKSIYNRICRGMEQSWSLDQLSRTSSYPEHKLELAARELLAMGMIEQPPAGMQSDLFQTAG